MDIQKEMNPFVKEAIRTMNPYSDQKPDNSPTDTKEEDGDYSDKYIKWFSDISNKDIQTVGGKGASLGEMFSAKFPVPPGFSITTFAFESFMSGNNLVEKIKEIIESVTFEETEALQNASKEIRALIEKQEISKELATEILESYHILGTEKIDERGISQDALNILKNSQEPIFVSVRSSATTEDLVTASFAGQQDSFLNVKGDRQLLEYVKKCFSSLYTARAMYYRNKQGFKEGEALLSIVIQKMVDSEKSGVIFSKDPTNKTEHIIIEAVYGLGEGIVSGKISPDNYMVNKELKIEKIKTSLKKIAIVRNSSGKNETVKLSPERAKSQVLTNGEILEAADFAMKLEEHYKKPQDIEFAIENKKLYIIQSRPITTLKKQETTQGEISGNVILEGLGSSPGIGAGTVKIIESMKDLSKIKKGDILVTEMTNPDMVVAMERSTAIVTNEGGTTSHASIVSREIGIPCVVGTGEATTTLKDGMKITVDGSTGKVYEGEVAETTTVEIKPALKTERIKLKLIVDLPKFAERAAESEIDTIGLTRIEGIIASMGKHPQLYEKENDLEAYSKIIKEGIAQILKPFKQMWIRSSDIRTDEYGSLKGAPEKEINPMLGLHGIRFSLKHPKIFEAELQAIQDVCKENPEKKVGVMFPQIISIEEIQQAKEHFNKFKTENMQFGVMIETPASVQIIEDICNEGVDFVSFGTNDLTQFTLGVDRGEEGVQHLYNELHPAVISQIKRVINTCRKYKVETSICGQAGSKKEMVEILFRKGINSISVNADAAYDISKLIKDLEEKREAEFKEKQSRSPNPQRSQDQERPERQQKPFYQQRNNSQERPHHQEQPRQNNQNNQHPQDRKPFNQNNFKKKKNNKHRKPWDKKGEFAPDNSQQNNQPQSFNQQQNQSQNHQPPQKNQQQSFNQQQPSSNQNQNPQTQKNQNQHITNMQAESLGESQAREPQPPQQQQNQPTLPTLPASQEPARLPQKQNEPFLNKNKIQIQAEPEEQKEKYLDNLESVEEKIEEVKQEVAEEVKQEIQQEKENQENIQVTAEPIEEPENMGVYKPEETEEKKDKKYNYDFDDFEGY